MTYPFNLWEGWFLGSDPVIIQSVVPGLSANLSGLKEGDKIKSINSIPAKTYDEFVNYSWLFNKQERTIEVERNGKIIDLNLLNYFDSEEDFHLEYVIKQSDYEKDAAKFGFNFVYNSDIIQEYLTSTTSDGLVINNVMKGPAFYAGLMKNDIIISISEAECDYAKCKNSDSSDNFSILSELEPNKTYIFDIERNSEKLKSFAKPVTNDTFHDDLKVYKRISNLQNNIDDTLLPKCIEGADVWTDCFARYEWPEGSSFAGDIYTGEWKDNQMNGLGKLFVGNHSEFAETFLLALLKMVDLRV